MQVIKSDSTNRNVIENMMQLYLHDLSPYTNDSVDDQGVFSLGQYFDLYWEESGRYPYILMLNRTPIGFALVRQIENNAHSIAEFFVLRPFRRRGIATQFSHQVFGLHPGVWQVAQLEGSHSAHTFWRKSISSYTNDQFEETWSSSQPKGPMQTFISGDQS